MTDYSGSSGTNYLYVFDGSGNVAGLVNSNDGSIAAEYDYGPFGEKIRSTGSIAMVNPFRFSTKYEDIETEFYNYGYRYYSPSTGRWLNRDSCDRNNEPNIYAFVNNDPHNHIDPFGLWETWVHHRIIDLWLDDKRYSVYLWHCCYVPVKRTLREASDYVDGEIGNKYIDFFYWGFWGAQSSRNAYQHGMASPNQTVAEAQAKYEAFIAKHLLKANSLADQARAQPWAAPGSGCNLLVKAVFELGEAYHAYSDSLSPAHIGFQTWYGPVDGTGEHGMPSAGYDGRGGVWGYADYALEHHSKETTPIFEQMSTPTTDSVKNKFQTTLDGILK